MGTTTISIDIAKQKFHLIGEDVQRKLTIDKEMSRKKVMTFLANHVPVEIVMESCAGSNWLCQEFTKMGHRPKRISPQHVKPFASYQKNDRNDAKAILEASVRPEMVFVAVKNQWQQDLQCLHKIRDAKLKSFRSLNSQIRGFLFEYGITVPEGTTAFFKTVGLIIESSTISLLVKEELRALLDECRSNYQKAQSLEDKIADLCKENIFFQKAIDELPGVGPLIASRFLSTIGCARNFRNGRQVAAHLGLVPRQNSSGGKTKLMGITKHGDVGLRTMLIQGARAKLAGLKRKQYHNDEEKQLVTMVEKKGFNVAAVALANRNARRSWAIMNKSE